MAASAATTSTVAPGAPAEVAAAAGDWVLPGHDYDNSRAAVSTIDGANVRSLAKAWSHEVQGSLSTVPLIVGDTVYVQDGSGRISAIDRATGEPRWESEAYGLNIGPFGVAVADGRVFGMHGSKGVVALDAASGRALGEGHHRHTDHRHRHPAHRLRRAGAGEHGAGEHRRASTRAATAASSTHSTPRPARSAGRSTRCSATTCGATPRSTRAAGRGTPRRSTPSRASSLGHRQPGPVPGHARVPERLQPARATTSTPTPRSPSTWRPASCAGTTRSIPTTSSTATWCTP